MHGAVAMLAIVRLLAPLSGARATSQRPALRWQAPANEPVQVELCRDRACTQLLETLATRDARAMPKAALPAGAVWWRVRARGEVTPAWELWIGRRSAPVDGLAGQWLDVDGDGFADAAVGRTVRRGGPKGLQPQGGGAFDGIERLVLVGDLDGDGLSDGVAVAERHDSVRIHYGGAGGLSRTPSQTVTAPKKTRTFATAVAGAGDVNGDGYGDFVVGAPGLLEAYVCFGGPARDAPPAMLTLSKASRHEHSSFGVTVGGAGDVDGDGLADFTVTASGNNFLYLFRGAAPRPASEPWWSLFGGGDTQWASALRGAGDVDGDGYADLVYSFLPDESGEENYQVRLAHGSPKGPRAASRPLPIVPREQGYLSVGGAGDLDGDGFDDVFAFTQAIDELYVWFGGAKARAPTTLKVPAAIESVTAAGDVDGDGRADLLVQWKGGFGVLPVR